MLTNRTALGVIRRVARFVYRGAAGVNVINEGYRQNLLALGVPAEKLRLIHCWTADSPPTAAASNDEFARREGLAGQFNVVYTGVMGPCQHLHTVLEAAVLLADEPRVQFILAGEGVERAELERRALDAGAGNVRFVGWRSPADAARLQAAADALLVHLKPDAMSRMSIPSKTFSYMAVGKPILMAVEGEAAELVRTHECGVVAAPSNSSALADAVRRLLAATEKERQTLGANARRAYENHFSPEVQVAKVVASLAHVARCRPADTFYQRRGKRWLDLAIAVPALFLLGPLLALTALLVRFKFGRPVLFKQMRPGRRGQIFQLYKFRTMTDERDAQGGLLPDERRLTRFGRFLRATSLDELPELWNVMRGDMSLVGPRPLLAEYLDRYSPNQSRRHEVRPGVTGLAQVRGRNEVSWEDRLAWDVEYVDSVSLVGDLKIIALTLGIVVRRRGVSAPGHATMPPFQGLQTPNASQRAA
jgi:lipopolysaccharide/colanic/teichoic acid biosynthesis glycosyltransferase